MRVSNSNLSSVNFAWIVAFILLPFPTFITSLFYVKNKVTNYIILGFFIIFGWYFTIDESTGFDSIRYVEFFESISKPSLLYALANYVSFDGSIKDIYIYILAYFSKSFSDSYHVFFLFEAFIFGLFFIGTLNVFRIKAVHNINNKYWFLMVVILMSTNSIFNINGIRFWTASWIAVYSILSSIELSSKKYIIFLFLTPLVHSTYIIIVALYILYLLFGRYERFWFWTMILAYPMSNVVLKFLPLINNSLPLIYQKTFSHYTEQEYIISTTSGTGFTIIEKLSEFSIDLLMIYVLVICFKKRNIIFNYLQRELFRFALLVVTFLNLAGGVPSLAGRFRWVFFPIILYLLWLNLDKTQFKRIFKLLPCFFAFKIIYTLFKQIAKVVPPEIIYSNIVLLINK